MGKIQNLVLTIAIQADNFKDAEKEIKNIFKEMQGEEIVTIKKTEKVYIWDDLQYDAGTNTTINIIFNISGRTSVDPKFAIEALEKNSGKTYKLIAINTNIQYYFKYN